MGDTCNMYGDEKCIQNISRKTRKLKTTWEDRPRRRWEDNVGMDVKWRGWYAERV